MIRSFRHAALKLLWISGKDLKHKTLMAQSLIDALGVVNSIGTPRDASFVGFRYDEWSEAGVKRYGVMVSDHWLISFGWLDGHAVDVDLERID